jgi:hypothetical protein
MSIVRDILIEEKNRLIELQKQLNQKIDNLPKGSISRKKRGNIYYCYLAHREGKRIIFKYIGREKSLKVNELKEKINQRKQFEKRMKEAKQNLREVKRGLGER